MNLKRIAQSYYGLQLTFVLVLILIWLSLLMYSWFIANARTERRLRTEFERILFQKDTLLSNLGDRERSYVNDEKTIRLAQILSFEYLNRLRHESSHGSLDTQSLPALPFQKHCGVWVARKGRIVFHDGIDLDSYFGKEWAKGLFLGIRSKGEMFTRRAKVLYSFPLTFEEFQSTKDTFQVIFRRGNFFLRYFTEEGDHQILFMLHLDPLTALEVKQQALQMFVDANSRLRIGIQDLFVFGKNSKQYSESGPGLEFIEQPESLYEHLLSRPYLLLCLVFPAVFLYLKGGYLLLATRLEFRYLLYLVVPFLMGLTMLWVELETHEEHFYLELRSEQQARNQAAMATTAMKFHEYLKTSTQPIFSLKANRSGQVTHNIKDPMLQQLLETAISTGYPEDTPIGIRVKERLREEGRARHSLRTLIRTSQAEADFNRAAGLQIQLQEWRLHCVYELAETHQAIHCEPFGDIANRFLKESNLKDIGEVRTLIGVPIQPGLSLITLGSDSLAEWEIQSLKNLHEVRESQWLEWWTKPTSLFSHLVSHKEFTDRAFLMLSSLDDLRLRASTYPRLAQFILLITLFWIVFGLAYLKNTLLNALTLLKSQILKLRFQDSSQTHTGSESGSSALAQDLETLSRQISHRLNHLPWISSAFKQYLLLSDQAINSRQEQGAWIELYLPYENQSHTNPQQSLARLCERYPLLLGEGLNWHFYLALPGSLSSRPAQDALVALLELKAQHPNLRAILTSGSFEACCFGTELYKAPRLRLISTMDNPTTPFTGIAVHESLSSDVKYLVDLTPLCPGWVVIH